MRAAFTNEEFYNNPGIINVVPKHADSRPEGVSLFFLTALVNSLLFFFWHMKNSPKAELKTSIPKILIEDVKSLPVRSIEFTTPQKIRFQLLEKGKTLYERYLASSDVPCVTGFVDHCLQQKPEQVDVVHDLLAFLAEQLMAMNKKKQEEMKGFLDWLEATIGVKANTLKNKTKLAAYDDETLEELLDLLKENKKVLKINPVSREFFDPLKDAFENSLARLSPLKLKIATTDRLIDLIVYILYGLTDEEVKLVEGGVL